MMSFWYLATVYSKYSLGIVHAHAEACRQAALLVKAGIPVYSPIAHTHPIAIEGDIDPFDHNVWLEADRAFMESAKGLIVCKMDGWQESYGIGVEIESFERQGKPIFSMEPGSVPADVLEHDKNNRHCEQCGCVFQRKERDSQAEFRARRYCGRRCRDIAKTKPMKQRLLEKSEPHPSGCLLWTAGKNAAGYGTISTKYKQRPQLAHRASYEAFVGPITDGLHVLHKCDNPACIEPTHLFLGTQSDNMRDKARKGRGGVKLTPGDVLEVRKCLEHGDLVSDIAARFGVSGTMIRNIASGRFWADLEPRRNIIAFCGVARSGKDTAAQGLDGFTRVAFADGVREALLALNPECGPYESVAVCCGNGKDWDTAKRQPECRELLQRMGTEAGRNIHGDDCWIRLAKRKIDAIPGNVVITDVRFANEAAAIREWGGTVVRIERPGVEACNDHASERLDFEPDTTIVNDGTVADLHEKVRDLVGGLGLCRELSQAEVSNA